MIRLEIELQQAQTENKELKELMRRFFGAKSIKELIEIQYEMRDKIGLGE